jgi:hypothetical protein
MRLSSRARAANGTQDQVAPPGSALLVIHRPPAAGGRRSQLPPLGSAHHHVDLAAPATGTDELFMPFENRNLGAAGARMPLARRAQPDGRNPGTRRSVDASCGARTQRFVFACNSELEPIRLEASNAYLTFSTAAGNPPGENVQRPGVNYTFLFHLLNNKFHSSANSQTGIDLAQCG